MPLAMHELLLIGDMNREAALASPAGGINPSKHLRALRKIYVALESG